MELEHRAGATPSPMRKAFYNDAGLRAGWRLLIYCGMIRVLVSAFGLIARQLGAGAAKGSSLPDYVQGILQLVGELILFLVILFLTWVMSRIEKRQMGVYGLPLRKSFFSGFAAGYVLWGFLPLVVLLSILRALHVFFFGSPSAFSARILGFGLIWFASFLLVAFFEEYLFRGYFLYTLADGIGFWPAVVIQAVFFARAHMGNGGETRIGIIATAFFALFAAVTLWRTGNLWLAVGAHAGWDWGQSFFFGVNDSGFQAPGHLFNPPPVTQGPAWLTGGSVGPEGSVVTLILWAIMALVFAMLYRRRREPALVLTIER